MSEILVTDIAYTGKKKTNFIRRFNAESTTSYGKPGGENYLSLTILQTHGVQRFMI